MIFTRDRKTPHKDTGENLEMTGENLTFHRKFIVDISIYKLTVSESVAALWISNKQHLITNVVLAVALWCLLLGVIWTGLWVDAMVHQVVEKVKANIHRSIIGVERIIHQMELKASSRQTSVAINQDCQHWDLSLRSWSSPVRFSWGLNQNLLYEHVAWTWRPLGHFLFGERAYMPML